MGKNEFGIIFKVFVAVYVIVFLGLNILYVRVGNRQFVDVANNLLEGRFDISGEIQGGYDLSVFRDKYYWPLGVMPAAMLVPMLKFGWVEPDRLLQLVAVFLTAILIFLVHKKMGWKSGDAGWWVVAALVSSPYLFLANIPSSWYQGQIVATLWWWFVLVTSEYSYSGVLAGVGVGALFLTRTTAGIGAGAYLMLKQITRGKMFMAQRIGLILIPCVISFFIWGGYNQVRFGRWWEQGYQYQNLPIELIGRRENGLFSIKNVPDNLYYLLLAVPQLVSHYPFITPSPWGMSIFITSPWLFYLIKVFKKNVYSWGIFAVAGMILVPIICYYGIGWRQYGYRYVMDVLPLVGFYLAKRMKEKYEVVPWNFKLLVLVSAVFNFYNLANAQFWI